MTPSWLFFLVMVATDSSGSFEKTGSPQEFVGSGLYGYINGGAEIFLELGFEKVVIQDYRKGNDTYKVELYTMVDQAAALGIYLMKCGKEKRHPELKVGHTLGRQQIMFHRGKIYTTIYHTGGGSEWKENLLDMARMLISRMPKDKEVQQLALLPREGQIAGSLRLIRGPFGLQAIYSLGEGDILGLGGKLTAVSADYRDTQGHRFTRIMVSYPTSRVAGASFGHVMEHLDSYLKVIHNTPDCLAFVDFSKKFGVIRKKGRQLDIMVDLRTKENCHHKMKRSK